MNIKTSELIDCALDWAVAKCEGRHIADHEITDIFLQHRKKGAYNYSTNPAQAYTIILRERISLRFDCWEGGGCRAFIDRGGSSKNIICAMHGPTPLIAAMRTYVMYRLGDEVEVPERLK